MAEISPLRRRMIEDMTVRNLSPATQRSYIHAVTKISRHFGCSPARLDVEDVRAFQVHLIANGISWPSLNQIVCALRFFYGVTLARVLARLDLGVFYRPASVSILLRELRRLRVPILQNAAFFDRILLGLCVSLLRCRDDGGIDNLAAHREVA